MKKLKHREVKSFASVTQLIKYGAGLTQKDSQVRALIFLTWDKVAYMGLHGSKRGCRGVWPGMV